METKFNKTVQKHRRRLLPNNWQEKLPLRRVLFVLGLLAMLFLVCLPPFIVGTPRPTRDQMKLVMFNTSNAEWTTVYMNKADGKFYWAMAFSSTHRERQKVIISRWNTTTRFYLEVEMTDGTVQISEPMDCSGARQQYKYDAKTNVIEKRTFVSGFSFQEILSILGFTLYISFGIPLLSGCITAPLFKLKPMEYVFLVNLIFVSVMFFVLTYLYGKDRRAWWHFPVYELITVILEYLFYTKTYKDQEKRKLLKFTVLSNALSGGIFELILHLFY